MLKRMLGLFLSLTVLIFFNACATVDNAPAEDQIQVMLYDEALDKSYTATINTNGSITIGRSDSCNIVISGDDYISRTHCQLAYSDGKIFLSDLGSTNGTFILVDEQWILLTDAVELKVGEQFIMADKVITLQSADKIE